MIFHWKRIENAVFCRIHREKHLVFSRFVAFANVCLVVIKADFIRFSLKI